MLAHNNQQELSLLTKTELEWLMGKKKVSKVYEYRMRSDIKKKLQIFQQSELPLLTSIELEELIFGVAKIVNLKMIYGL